MKKYLVDTHALLWWASAPDKLSEEARLAIRSGHNQLFFSYASMWEISITLSLGKLKLPEPATKLVEKSRCQLLPIQLEHLDALTILPWHHRDPFDRMIISQAITDNLAVISSDKQFDQYNISLLVA